MKQYSAETLDHLANEYALGTLHGQARIRFEKLFAAHPSIANRVRYWQNQFAELAAKTQPVQPNKRVWRNIQKRLDGDKQKPAQNKWLGAWAVAASAAFIMVLASYLLQPTYQAEDYFAQVAFIGEGSQPQWIIQADLEKQTLTTTAINASAAALDKTFELWSLPQEGQPQSLGLLPVNQQSQQKTISPALVELLKQNQTIAVSIEPVGGSPTGLPTGDVVFTGTFYEL